MFSNEFKIFLKELLTSWQLIAVAIVVLLYFLLVSYVTNFRRSNKLRNSTPRVKRPPKEKKKKKEEEKSEEDELLEEE